MPVPRLVRYLQVAVCSFVSFISVAVRHPRLAPPLARHHAGVALFRRDGTTAHL
jgi:hypothetical protein